MKLLNWTKKQFKFMAVNKKMIKNNIIKLNKQQTNEIIKTITKENEEYGLALKLIYIYGRNIGEVANLKKEDILLEDNIIIFNKDTENEIKYNIHESVKIELSKLIELKQDTEYIFHKPIKLKDNINYQLYKKTGMDELDYIKGLKLTTKDFKILRGQHLYSDGVSIHSIHELYNHKNLESTKKLIRYTELKNKKVDIENILKEYTDMNLYSVSDYPITYYCTNRKNREAILELYENNINIHGDSEIRNILNNINSNVLVKELDKLSSNGDYKYIKGLRVMKN